MALHLSQCDTFLFASQFFFFFQAEDGIRDDLVTGVQTCALPIYFPRIALTAASLHSATRSAPLNPFVESREISFKLTSFASGIGEVSIFIISSLALSSGGPIYKIKSS